MLLNIEGLTKRYDAEKVLDGINFTLDCGEIGCVLGPSGCGKTTLLKIIAGLEGPDAGLVDTAVLREPFVSRVMLEEPSVRIGLNLQSGWKSATDMRLPQAVLAVKQDLAEENPELVEKFNSQYGEAINWVNDNGEQAAEMAKKFMDTPFKVTKRSMPRINLIFARAREVKPEITRYLELLMEANKKSIGGRVPGEKFYF